MNTPVIYEYNGSKISFAHDENIMVNATEMAKPFGKRPVDWLKTQSAIEFIKALTEVKILTSPDFQSVTVVKGGTTESQGTWMHEDVALEFARWLSPKFAIWCNDRIKELLTTGTTSLQTYDVPQSFSDALLLAAKQQKQIEDQQKAIELKNQTIQTQSEKIERDKPKVVFADAVAGSDSSVLVAELAKMISQNGFHIGQNRLFQWLRDKGYLCKHGERRNLPCQQYLDQGLFALKANAFSINGEMKMRNTVKVTQKGCVYFINGFLSGRFNINA